MRLTDEHNMPTWPAIIGSMVMSFVGLAVCLHELFRKPLKRTAL